MPKGDAVRNVLASPIFAEAEAIINSKRVDWLIAVVKSMIADDADLDDPWYNLFSTSRGKVVLVSTYELRRYAAEAGRPFEVAVAGTGLSALLAAMIPEIEYQDNATGSIFDFCEVRGDIVKSIRTPRIDPANRKRIPAPYLEAADRILTILERYKGDSSPSEISRQRRLFADAEWAKTPVARTVKKSRASAKSAEPAVGSPVANFGEILKRLQSYAAEATPKKTTKETHRPRAHHGAAKSGRRRKATTN